jgi:type I restriction enzyme R subunit
VERYAAIFYAKTAQAAADTLGKLQGFAQSRRWIGIRLCQKLSRELFRSTLSTFIRIYSFITQVERLFDEEDS